MKHKFTQKEQQHAAEQNAQQRVPREFSSVEEMLRFDASQIRVPPTIESRLRESVGEAPEAKRSLWQRLFGK